MTQRAFAILLLMILPALAGTTDPAAAESKAVLSAADFARPDSPTSGIQETIDALPAQGGVVNIPPGVWRLRRAVVLRSHVTLRGAGSTTILTRGKEAHAKLTRDARKGETTVEVASTKGFRPGDEVALMDDAMHGWYLAHPIVKEVRPKSLLLARPIESGHAEGVFRVQRNAVVVNYFPMICASRMHSGGPVEDVAVRDLVLDGNLPENPGPWTDFTLAAVHWANVSDSLVQRVTIRGSVGDGIGVQGGRDNRVQGCLIEDCRGHGLHPGTALRGGIFADNISRRNGGDGLFFCWQVVGITVTGNLLHENAKSGIGGLGAGGTGGDRFNIVSGNICRQNGHHGIEATGGRDNVITGNVCLDNSQEKPGRSSGIFLGDTSHTLVTANRCGADGERPTQKLGIQEQGKSDTNVITGNLCAGNLEGGVTLVGKGSEVSGNLGGVVGPK